MRKGTIENPIAFDGNVSSVSPGDYFLFDGHLFYLEGCACGNRDCRSAVIFDGEDKDYLYIELSAVFRYFLIGRVGFECEGIDFDWDGEIQKAVSAVGIGVSPRAFRKVFQLVLERFEQANIQAAEREKIFAWPSMEQTALN